MKIIKIKTEQRIYSVYIGEKISNLGKILNKFLVERKVLIISNPTVAKYYLDILKKSLLDANFEVFVGIVEDGEEYKSLSSAEKLYQICSECRLERNSTIIALGGGVIGDLAGFVASTYLRGINLVQVPTTLLAQVDSSIGGKVGVNLPAGKNLVGSFYQPLFVLSDPDTLDTLPEREYKEGIAEVIKYGVIKDAGFFSYLENNINSLLAKDKKVLEYVITTCVKIKGKIVQKDEKEISGLRAILNYGHTFGHALEKISGFTQYRHGEMVAIGMVEAAKIACENKIFAKKDLERIKLLIKKAGLPYEIPTNISKEEIKNAMLWDKKVKDEKIRFILPTKIGKVILREEEGR